MANQFSELPSILSVREFESSIKKPIPAQYVDKTHILANLIKQFKICSLSRPRRFGKSTTLFIIKELFTNGTKNLKNYAIAKENLLPELEPCPVLFFNLVGFDVVSIESFLDKFRFIFREVAFANNIELEATKRKHFDPCDALEEIFRKISSDEVVILIDEYDMPLLNILDNPPLYELASKILRNFFIKLKAYQQRIHFMLITGVNRISNLSIFSGFNNIIDISFYHEFASIVGYTEQELLDNFSAPLAQIADFYEISLDELIHHLKANYNGYCFDQSLTTTVFNTWDINQLLTTPLPKNSSFQLFPPFWVESGAFSNFVLRYFKHNRTSFISFINNQILASSPISLSQIKNKVSFLETPLQTFLFNAGYLTLTQKYDQDFILDFPNNSVKNFVLADLVYNLKSFDIPLAEKLNCFKRDIEHIFLTTTSDLERKNILSAAIASCGAVANDCFTNEAQLRTLLFALFRNSNLEVQMEIPKIGGRIDLLVRSRSINFIIELKVINSAKLKAEQIIKQSQKMLLQAFNQIYQKRYTLVLPHSMPKYFMAIVANCFTGEILALKVLNEKDLSQLSKNVKLVTP